MLWGTFCTWKLAVFTSQLSRCLSLNKELCRQSASRTFPSGKFFQLSWGNWHSLVTRWVPGGLAQSRLCCLNMALKITRLFFTLSHKHHWPSRQMSHWPPVVYLILDKQTVARPYSRVVSALEKKEIRIHVTVRMNFENAMLHGKNIWRHKKNLKYDFPYMKYPA